jgi:hypothetical protein
MAEGDRVFSQLPSLVTSTVEHPLGFLSLLVQLLPSLGRSVGSDGGSSGRLVNIGTRTAMRLVNKTTQSVVILDRSA